MSEGKTVYTDDGYITVYVSEGRVWIQMEDTGEPQYCALDFALDKALALAACIGWSVVQATEGTGDA